MRKIECKVLQREMRKSLALIAIIALACSAVVARPDEQLQQKIMDAVVKFHEEKTVGSRNVSFDEFIPLEAKPLVSIAKNYFNEKNFKPINKTVASKSLACNACIGGVNSLLYLLNHNIVDNDGLAKIFISICSVVLDRRVCEGVTKNYLPELQYINDNGEMPLNGARFCALVMQDNCGDWESVNAWKIDIPHGKPPVEIPQMPQETNGRRMKILHLSDVHLDFEYQEGTTNDCGLPMCCRNTSGQAESPEKSAGPWGSYKCDLPYWTFNDILRHIREVHFEEISYIMITGDYPGHDVWAQSRENNTMNSIIVRNYVHDFFPNSLIIPSIGNHESFPCNSYPPNNLEDPDFKIDWLYSSMASLYKDFVPHDQKDAFVESLSTKGYYTILMEPGFRIVMVNPNACYAYNFWLNYEWIDQSGGLAWLVDVLLKAEQNNERVHIISHIPPGNGDCLGAWGREYSKIIERFENTVVAQFYGHTHNDEFVVFYDSETKSRPTNVGFVTPSVTTYTGFNPSYTIFTVDGPYPNASMRIIDKETYVMDLKAANENGLNARPNYIKLMNMRDDLEMDTLFPADYDKLVHRLATDDEFYEKYFRFYNHGSYGSSEDTRRDVVCGMVTTSNIDDRKCVELMGNAK